jgi:adenine-specific DNA-methyltransferase
MTTKTRPEPVADDLLESKIVEFIKKESPDVFSEGLIDFDKLKRCLGSSVQDRMERYGLSWTGKTDCFRQIQQPIKGKTLIPCPAESINFDTSKNLFIEGDNLQVLKLLQRVYHSKIKMIYIDPPYNTGSDSFVYPDRFKEKLDEYQKRAGIKDDEGNWIGDVPFHKNTKDNGHYHSNWISMMYPRLFLARQLLRDDGVIFVSIDDNEAHNLRLIMDEIFGEENFEGNIHWRRRHNQPNDKTKMIGLVAEHIIVYSRDKETLRDTGVGKVRLTGDFANSDSDPRGDWASKPWKVGSGQSGSRYEITLPNGTVLDEEWMGEEKTFKTLLSDGRIIFPRNGAGMPRKKYFKKELEEEGGQCATNWWSHDEFGHNQGASDTLSKLFDGKNIFDNPKPIELLRGMISVSNTKQDDLILDFFSGSGTTAQAVMELNRDDGGDRKFICVQLAESLDPENKDQKAGADFCDSIGKTRNIAEICKERIRRAIKNLDKKSEGNLPDGGRSEPEDLGFKAFKLGESRIRDWECGSAEELPKQIEASVNNIKTGTTDETLLFELMLSGEAVLTAEVEKKVIGKDSWYSVDEGSLAICVSRKMSQSLLDSVLKAKPRKAIFLDESFNGNDKIKKNATLQFRDAGIEVKFV